MCLFSFSFPIGWNELGVIATTATVIVALYANRKATKQLKSALDMQEQSKNIELFDKRVSLTEAIGQGNPVSDMSLSLLFDEKIYTQYQKIHDLQVQRKNAEQDKKDFFYLIETTPEVKEKIEKYEEIMSHPDCPTEVFEEFKEYCKSQEISYSITRLNDDIKTYNYSEISFRIDTLSSSIKSMQESLTSLMKKLISESIKPLSSVKLEQRVIPFSSTSSVKNKNGILKC